DQSQRWPLSEDSLFGAQSFRNARRIESIVPGWRSSFAPILSASDFLAFSCVKQSCAHKNLPNPRYGFGSEGERQTVPSQLIERTKLWQTNANRASSSPTASGPTALASAN